MFVRLFISMLISAARPTDERTANVCMNMINALKAGRERATSEAAAAAKKTSEMSGVHRRVAGTLRKK